MQRYLSAIDALSENLSFSFLWLAQACYDRARDKCEIAVECVHWPVNDRRVRLPLHLSRTFKLLECIIRIYWQNDFFLLTQFFSSTSDKDFFIYSIVILTLSFIPARHCVYENKTEKSYYATPVRGSSPRPLVASLDDRAISPKQLLSASISSRPRTSRWRVALWLVNSLQNPAFCRSLNEPSWEPCC